MITINDLKGELKNSKLPFIEKMLEEQEKQGNPKNVKIFQNNHNANFFTGGVNWDDIDWANQFSNVISITKLFNNNKTEYDKFFKRFPETKNVYVETYSKTDFYNVINLLMFHYNATSRLIESDYVHGETNVLYIINDRVESSVKSDFHLPYYRDMTYAFSPEDVSTPESIIETETPKLICVHANPYYSDDIKNLFKANNFNVDNMPFKQENGFYIGYNHMIEYIMEGTTVYSYLCDNVDVITFPTHKININNNDIVLALIDNEWGLRPYKTEFNTILPLTEQTYKLHGSVFNAITYSNLLKVYTITYNS